MSSLWSATIGQNLSTHDINTSLIETVGLYGRNIANRWQRTLKDKFVFNCSAFADQIILPRLEDVWGSGSITPPFLSLALDGK
jgi:hypothetical protein